MGWILPRLVALVATVGVGGSLGAWAGASLGWPVAGTLAGAALGATVAQLVDALGVASVLRWLRLTPEHAAPMAGGFWGDVAYRIERALRLRDQALAEERQRLSEFLSAIEASPNGVLLLDHNDQIAWCNLVAADHLGLDPQRDRGQPVTNLVRAPVFVAYLQGTDWGEPATFTTLAGELTLQVLVRAYGDGQKLVVTQDVTERLRADAMRRDFVANVSHEIRTPLTVLAGFVETMQSLPLSTTERGRVLTLMQQQTDRMRALVSDLLTLAQLEGSPRPPADRWVLLPALAQRVAADARTLSAGRHTVVLNEEGPSVSLAGAEAELFSAAINLATNAVRYTPDGGQIVLAWRQRPDGSLEVEVQDSGVGVSREHLPRLTERFYRVDASRARETGGTGLGLAIVKHVMQRHGGTLEVDSTPGKGSRFRLVFPAARVRPLAEGAGSLSPAVSTSV